MAPPWLLRTACRCDISVKHDTHIWYKQGKDILLNKEGVWERYWCDGSGILTTSSSPFIGTGDTELDEVRNTSYDSQNYLGVVTGHGKQVSSKVEGKLVRSWHWIWKQCRKAWHYTSRSS